LHGITWHYVTSAFTTKFAGGKNLPASPAVKDTLKKSSFPRRWESRVLILLDFAFGKNGFSE
jgi:hypothetical protein